MARIGGALAIGIALLLVVAVAGHGGEAKLGSGDLVWDHQPHVYRNAELPDDRVVRGVVRNDSLRVVTLTARDLKVRTRGGNELESAAIFAPTFIRGVFPQNRGEATPENEQMRIGLSVRLEPGKSAPITVSWRQHGERASRVEYGTGSLPLPQPLKRRMSG
jgi:hypothetical protein